MCDVGNNVGSGFHLVSEMRGQTRAVAGRSKGGKPGTKRQLLKRLAVCEGDPHEEDVVFVAERNQRTHGPGTEDQREGLHPRKELRCYEVLGLQRGADLQEVRTAYRQRALEAHPDRPQGSQAAFLSIAEAFETLSDRSAREVYDRELVISDSPDGLCGAGRATSSSKKSEVIPDTETCPLKVCQALVTLSMSDWGRRISRLSSQVLEEARRHLADGIDGLNGAGQNGVRSGSRMPLLLTRSKTIRRQQSAPFPVADNVLKSVAKGMHLYRTGGRYWFAQICVGGLTIRSHLTKCMGTAADGHIALLAYKEHLLLVHGKKEEQSFDVYFRQARAQARAQHIDPYGDQFSYFFVKTFPVGGKVNSNKPFCVRTPTVKDLDTALAHRRVVLEMLERGNTRSTVHARILRLRAEVKVTQQAWKDRCSKVEQQLAGYIMRELEQRKLNNEPSASKRRRLQGKQSQALIQFRLPWFSRFAAVNGLSRHELVTNLLSLQDSVERSPHLQDCMQRALQGRLEDSNGRMIQVEEREGLGNGKKIKTKMAQEASIPSSGPAVTRGVASSSSGTANSSASGTRVSQARAESSQRHVEDVEEDDHDRPWGWTSKLFPGFPKLQRHKTARKRQRVVPTPGPVIMEVDSD